MDFCYEDFLREGTLFSLPDGKFLAGWGERTLMDAPRKKGVSFFCPDFFLKHPKCWHGHAHTCILDLHAFRQNKEHVMQMRRWMSPHEKVFAQTFNEIKNKINQGKLLKAVPYAFIESHEPLLPQELDAILAHCIRERKNSSKVLYGSWNATGGFLGVTPETLFKHDIAGTFHTMALAGTVPIAEKQRLQEDPKLLREHSLVVQDIKERLKSYGVVIENPMRLLEIAPLAHALTDLSLLEAQNITFNDAVRLLHPTLALGAGPGMEGKKWLEECDLLIPRGNFGAPIGYYDASLQAGACFVAIRQMSWNSSSARIGAGCGVVAKSILKEEWKEIHLKWQAILRDLYGEENL